MAKTRRKPARRKQEGPVRGQVIPVRVTDDEKAQIEQRAARHHLGASTWLRKMALEAPDDPPATAG